MPVSKIPGAGISGGSVTVNQSAPSNSLVIDSSGLVGIGTASPVTNLQVVGSNPYIRAQSSSTGESGFQLGNSSYNWSLFFNSGVGPSNGVGFYDNTAGATRFSIGSNGDVAIGNTGGKNAGLAVTGNSKTAYFLETTSNNDVIYILANTGGSAGTSAYIMPIRTGSTQTFQGGVQWTGSAVAYNTSSDYRLKENVTPLFGALDRVMQLKPVSYSWKSNGKSDNGFLAHELQAILPNSVSGEKDAVFEDGSINPQCVDYSKLVATLTAAIQEQQAMIEELKARIETLEAK